jgi:uncharacterized protein YggE
MLRRIQGMKPRIRWIIFLALLLLVASAISGIAQPRFGHSATAADKTITVTGSGIVSSVPDRATFTFTVESRAKTATGALAQNNDAMTAVIAAVKGAGVPAASIQTSQVALMQQSSQDGTSIIGYIASNTITVKTDLGRSGKLVDAAVNAGATGFGGPMLSHSDEDGLYRDALKKAVEDSKAKAQALADAAGLKLGAVQSVTEGASSTPPIPYATKTADAGSMPIEAGTQDVQATVTVTYAAS